MAAGAMIRCLVSAATAAAGDSMSMSATVSATALTPHHGRPHENLKPIDRTQVDDVPPCQIRSRDGRLPRCPNWHECQKGAACESFRQWSVTGRCDPSTRPVANPCDLSAVVP
jgi:hypothetical protein